MKELHNTLVWPQAKWCLIYSSSIRCCAYSSYIAPSSSIRYNFLLEAPYVDNGVMIAYLSIVIIIFTKL